jgi:predicted ATP-grasp superfamily ATP-dependent carboligase
MTLEEARKICEEITKEHGLYCDYREERRDGEVKLVSLTLRFWINKKTIDFSKNCGKID